LNRIISLEDQMDCHRLWVVVVLMATILGASAAAQDEKNEVGGTIGRIFISTQGIQGATYANPAISFGRGLTVGGDYARQLFVTPVFSISGEAVIVYNPSETVNGGSYGNDVAPSKIKELFLTPAVRVNLFPTTAVSPWASFGVGFGHISESSTLVYGDPNPGKSTTPAVIEGGFGLDVKIWRQLSARAGVRDFWAGEPDFPLAPTGKSRFHNYFVSGGLFWRF
jgi:hypothetical protein